MTLDLHQLLGGLRATADPSRLRLLAVLVSGEFTVSELTEVLGQSQPRVSRHLKLLTDDGLLERVREQHWVYHRVPADGEGAHLARVLLGLVDRPQGIGKGAFYTQDHVEQLLLVRKWQLAGLSLERIGEVLKQPSSGPLPPTPRRAGTVEVWSHLVVADGVEITLEPGRAGDAHATQAQALHPRVAQVAEHLLQGLDGVAGSAVQSLNVMCGFEERDGLAFMGLYP